ncbi:uncharacterized protein V6R79_009913 [Siganus canaliculatus]
MDRDEGPEKLEDQVPTSPRASFEKPRVPLNNLKMKFERGDDAATVKGGRTTLRSVSSEDMDQHGASSVADRVLESTSMREKMAKYQAAVSKQGAGRSGVTPEVPALTTSGPGSQKHVAANECNGENSSEQPKAARKFRPPVRETCVACLKTVYPLERLVALQQVYHKGCFRCIHCSATLSLGNFASLHGNVYCKPHFNQLFKAKGNYDEGFGHRPHKELWEPRADGDEGEEAAKPKEQPAVRPAAATRPAESVSDIQPDSTVETSPPVKVTDLTALLETRVQTQTSAGDKLQSTERPAETRRLRVAWPPPAADSRSETAPLSPGTEGPPSTRASRAKWPPEDEVPSTLQSSDRAELVSLRRSSSLKERIRPFTVAPKLTTTASAAPREPRRPLKSLLEWRASFEEKQPKVLTKQSKPERQQVKEQEKKQETKHVSKEAVETAPEPQDKREEAVQREEAAADKAAVEEGSLRSISPGESPSPPLQPKQNRASQDVGFWEDDKEGSEAEELSAEDMIKRNRYYDEEEDSDS